MMDGKHNFNDFIHIDVEWERERKKVRKQTVTCVRTRTKFYILAPKCKKRAGRQAVRRKKRLDKTRLIRAWAAGEIRLVC